MSTHAKPQSRARNGRPTPGPRLRDLVYLDFEKAASVFSQIEGGLLRETQSSVEAGMDGGISGELNVGFAKVGSRLGASDKSLELSSRVLHHDVLARIESWLASEKILLDMNDVFRGMKPSEDEIRAAMVGGPPYVRAEGWVMLEDYRRMSEIAANFNSLMAFLIRCSTDTAKKSPEYQELSAQLTEMKERAKAQPNRDERAREVERVKSIERQLEAMLEGAASGGKVEDWLVQGIMQLVELFKRDHVNLRLYPFEERPGFQLLANLKPNCFVDGDLGNFRFAYGIKPNVKLTVLGIVTSMPLKGSAPIRSASGVRRRWRC